MAYARYLEKILQNAEEFNEVRDIVSRYETLQQTFEVVPYLFLRIAIVW